MKQIYLIRHGQTEQNKQRVFQDDSVTLNTTGLQQAAVAAERLADQIEIVLSSNLERALQTAKIIASAANCPLETLAILEELNNPPMIRGKSWDDPDADQAYQEWLKELLNDRKCDLQGAENYFDLSNRAQLVLDNLAARPETSIAVVSHSGLIGALMAKIIVAEPLSPEVLAAFEDTLKIRNASPIPLRITEDNGRRDYKIVLGY